MLKCLKPLLIFKTFIRTKDYPDDEKRKLHEMLKRYFTTDYRKLILNSKVYDVAIETPLMEAHAFSKRIRGAYNKIATLNENEMKEGIVCCSAGNHAQGVALSACKLKIDAKIVMPLATPEIKVRAVQQHGGAYATIVLHGKSYDEAAAEAKRLQKEENRTMILPFDDPFVIAGQGTIGMEILKQTAGKNIDAIFVCCGGGGLLAGIAAWVKQFRPQVKVIGVEASDAAGMTASLKAGRVVELETAGLFADGAAVRKVGSETFRVCKDNVDEMITVSTDDICAAIKSAFNDTRVILEPAGALAIAGVQKYVHRTGVTGSTFVATLSGANIDFDRLRFISERADSNETLISVKIKESPGAFKHLYDVLDNAGVIISEFSYRYIADSTHAHIYLSLKSKECFKMTVLEILQNEYEVLDLSNNELAKVHGRYLAGGRANHGVLNEVLYRFEFLDRPEALRKFLYKVTLSNWNISLFHYRNHGDNVGRVLVGFQLESSLENKNQFEKDFLSSLEYQYFEETGNETYQQFLL